MTLEAGLQRQEDRLLACVHCGFCLPACPTYTRLGDEADSPRGRLHLMRAVAEGRLEADSEAFQTHMDRCLGCRACESVCPSGVEYGLLLELARERAVEARPAPPATRALPAVFGSPLLSSVALVGGRLFRASGLPRLLARRLPGTGWSGAVKLAMAMLAASAPSRALEGVIRRGRVRRGDPSGEDPAAPRAPRSPTPVGVLQGCVQAGLFRRVNEATTRVLEANGRVVVPVPGQGCCGALHAHSGDLEGARRLARVNIAAFQAAGVDQVVVNAAGCGAAMKEYGHLLEDDPRWAGRARAFAAGVRDVTETLGDGPLRVGGALPLRATWDAPCHLLHAQGVSEPPLRLLRSIPELELVPLKGCEECCGGAGIYALTHRELGGRIGGDKVRAVQDTGAQVVATANPGCMMQIGAGLLVEGSGTEAVHPVELLDASYRTGGIYHDLQTGG